jgi:hypothetical protein
VSQADSDLLNHMMTICLGTLKIMSAHRTFSILYWGTFPGYRTYRPTKTIIFIS